LKISDCSGGGVEKEIQICSQLLLKILSIKPEENLAPIKISGLFIAVIIIIVSIEIRLGVHMCLASNQGRKWMIIRMVSTILPMSEKDPHGINKKQK
jgi:hypothetical protein